MKAYRRVLGSTLCLGLWLGTLANADEKPLPNVDSQLVLQEFDVAKAGDLLLLPVTVKGQQHFFLLDTGSGLTLYDKSLRQHLGKSKKKIAAQAPTGEIEIELFEPPEAALGGFPLRGAIDEIAINWSWLQVARTTAAPVGLCDLAMIRKASGYDIKGIVGMDFLRSCIIRIDFDHGKIAFLRSVGKHLGTALPFNTTDDYRPLIRPEIPGYGQEPFIVDTGCSCTGGICKKTYDELLRRQLIKPSGHSRCTTLLGGDADENVAEFRSGILAALRLANWSHCDLRFDELASSTLGLGYLSRYIVTIDFPRQVMYLKEGLALTRPDKDDLSGLALVRIKGETVVWGVRENSAAAIGGIKVKDVLIKMDDEKAEALSLFALRNALCCEGRTIRFTIRRGTEERLVSLRLADKPEREIDAIENSPRQMPTLKPIRKIRLFR